MEVERQRPAHGEFRGFPRAAQQFYRDLAVNNRRSWFEEHRDRFVDDALEPAKRFVVVLGERLSKEDPRLVFNADRMGGPGSILRIHRDVRFSPDKSPYKTNLGMLFWLDVGREKKHCPHFYVGVYPERVLVHGGLKTLPPPLLARYREAVADEERGTGLRQILVALERAGFRTGKEGYRRVPKPYDAAHPNADLLRYSGVFAELESADPSFAVGPRFVEWCLAACRRMVPLVRWVATSLGPGPSSRSASQRTGR